MVDTPTAWSGKAERAYELLKGDIQEGRFAPGQSLSEVELVEYTGASRTPVREAIRRLASEGLIDLEPRKAPSVARISLGGVRALFDFRRLLEPAAMRLVVERARTDAAIAAAFREIGAKFERMSGQEYSPAFGEEFRRLTEEFDAMVVAYTPNEYLARSIAELRPHGARVRLIAHEEIGRLGQSVLEHAEMCAAIVDGDAERAASSAANHLFHVEQAIFHALVAGTGRGTAAVDMTD